MADNPREAAAPEVCRLLRNKQMFMGDLSDPTVPGASDGFVWCVHTQNCLGPDGRVAGYDECSSSRGCFESANRRAALEET